MAIYTFSTKTKRPEDTAFMEKLKRHCEDKNLNFSSVVVEKLKELEVELNENRRKV